jgi:hypothetical protein
VSKQKGFSLVEGLLLVLVISIVGLGGWYVATQSDDEDDKTSTSIIETEEQADEESSEDNIDNDQDQSVTQPVSIDNQFYTLILPEGWVETSTEIGENDSTNKDWLRAYYKNDASGYSVSVILNERPRINVSPGSDMFHSLAYADNSFTTTTDITNIMETECTGDESYGCNYADGFVRSLSQSSAKDDTGNSYKFSLSKETDQRSADLTEAAALLSLIETK